jgi:hypothetical protein
MDQQQFAQLMTTVAAALRQTTAPLTAEQQAVALQFQLLRNGLGRFRSASEAFDRALIRVDQVQYPGGSELVFHDRIPRDARSMVLTVDSRRAPRELPASRDDGILWHRVDRDEVIRIVELVEFLDRFDVPIAAGVPLQVQGWGEDRDPVSDVADRSSGDSLKGRTTQRPQKRS